jgi:hypothetical protein
MAWTDIPDFVVGQTLTASRMNEVRNNLNVGHTVCTSTTRPSSPVEGTMIHESDTKKVYVWNGSAWRQVATEDTPIPGSLPQVLFSGSHTNVINVTNVTLNSSNCFNTVSYNNGNCFNASTGRFTVSIAGYYYASVHFGTNTNTEINCRIRQNGQSNTGPLAELWNQGANGAANVMAAAIIFCNANDYIDFEAARVNCLAGVQHKRFLIYLLQ